MNSKLFSILIVTLFVVALFMLPLGISPNINGSNYKNVTVQTRLNITNSRPEVVNITFQEASNPSLRNITISAGGLKTVYCNISVRDWNGFDDIVAINATIWHISNSSYSDIDNYTNHYTNTTCTFNATTLPLYYGWYVCGFDVKYYANDGLWMCNATLTDQMNATGSGWGNTTFYPVYALNVTDGIDYGATAIDNYTGNVTANVTNVGNMIINITVEGYGNQRGDGLAMICASGNITVTNERFATTVVDYETKTPLNGSAQMLSDLKLLKQTDDGAPVIGNTYWQLFVNSTNDPGGNCTGHIIFTAIAS